jgi:2,4-dienoyl-CoA reductase-like NADH-dependent reductase (Old Yellow Enzyme family)
MYDFLQKPLQLGSLTLRHRLVLPPMATEKAADGRSPRPSSPITGKWPRAALLW